MLRLTVLFFLSSLIGCFPVRVSLDSPVNWKFRWTHLITWYTLLILILDLVITFDARGYPTFCKIAFETNNSLHIITGYVENFNNLSSDRFIRLYAFFTCDKALKVIQLLHSLKLFTGKYLLFEDGMTHFPEISYNSKKSVDCGVGGGPDLFFSPTDQVTKVKSFAIRFHEKVKRLKDLLSLNDWEPCKQYVPLSCNFLLLFFNHLYIIISALGDDRSFVLDQKFFFLPELTPAWVLKVIFVINNVLIITSQLFNLIILAVLAQELAQLYREFKLVLLARLQEEPESGWKPELYNFRGQQLHSQPSFPRINPDRWVEDEEKFKNQFICQFKQLKCCCEFFSGICGFYALVNIGSVILSLGQFAFMFANNADLAYFSRSVACGLWIYVTVSVGERLEQECLSAREEIQDLLMSTSDVRVNENLRQVALWVSNSSCKLTASNIFTVNMRLIPGVIGTVMTYVIFLFQLTMSETKKLTEWSQ